MHNRMMRVFIHALLLLAFAGSLGMPAFAQETTVTGDQDGSSQAVEESDEAYRRRMELEDARRTDPTYTDAANDYRRDAEKIDKLPKESRENIRDQLVDVIVSNPEWQPEDALGEYPYVPSAAAQSDPELAQQEQEAWDEQIEKYHARESAAYGAYRGPVAGPGNPDGSGSQQGGGEQDGGEQGGEGGQQGQAGQSGQQGSSGSQGSEGTYEPYQSQNEDGEESTSTRGVSESALDFIRQRSPTAPSSEDVQVAEDASSDTSSETSETSTADEPQRGILAIEDLEMLEGTGSGVVVQPPEPEDPDDPDGY